MPNRAWRRTQNPITCRHPHMPGRVCSGHRVFVSRLQAISQNPLNRVDKAGIEGRQGLAQSQDQRQIL